MRDASAAIREKFEALRPLLNERTRRLWAAAEARALGRGGIACVVRATGLAPGTVRRGLRELQGGLAGQEPGDRARVRRRGGGAQAIDGARPGAGSGSGAAAGASGRAGTRWCRCAGRAAARPIWQRR